MNEGIGLNFLMTKNETFGNLLKSQIFKVKISKNYVYE